MKKSISTLAAACSFLLATACSNEASNNDQASTHTEMVQREEMAEGEMDHQEMSHTVSAETEMEVPQYEQVPAAVKTQVQQITNYYLEIKNALVASKTAEAQAAATKLIAPLEQFNASALPADQQKFYKEQAASIQDAAKGIISASDVEAQRKHFGPLSQSVYALNKSFAAKEGSLYRQYCPMANNNKGGYWLSAEKEVLNPYFGEKMLKCGKVAETL